MGEHQGTYHPWNGDHSDASKINLSKCIEHIEIWFQVTIWAFIMAISWWLGAGSVAKWWFGCFSCTFLHCINSMWNWESHPKWSLPNVFARWWFSGYIKFQSWSEVFNSVVVGCWSLKINKKACQIVTLASVQFNTRCKCIGFNLAMHYSRVIGQPRDLSFDQLQLKVLEQLGSKGFSSFNFCLYLDALHCIIYSKERETSLNLQMWQYDTSSFSRPPDLPFLSKYLWLKKKKKLFGVWFCPVLWLLLCFCLLFEDLLQNNGAKIAEEYPARQQSLPF